jgi:acylphosphatase
MLHISTRTLENMIKKSLGRYIEFQQGDYLVFRIFTENKEPHFIIAKVGNEYNGEYRFGGVGFRERIGSEGFYIKIEDVIKNPKDWYNKLIKGKTEEIKDYYKDYHSVKILSENKIKIINEKLNIEKTLNLENIDFRFIDKGRALGIKGEIKIEETGSKVKIAICTDGDGNIFMEVFEKKTRVSGNRIRSIDLNEERLKLKYLEGEKDVCILYFVDPVTLVKEITKKLNKWFINIDAAEAWFHAENNVVKGSIGEKAGMKMSKYIPECEAEGEIARGRPSKYSDVRIRPNGIESPEEVKTCDLTGKSIEERNDIFEKRLEEARGQIVNDFEKEVFKNSEAGIAIIIGFDENKIDPNAEYVEIEVLIAKIDKNTGKIIEYIYAPEWYNSNQ